HWPLDEEQGNKVSELVEGRSATVDHPLWIRNEHSNWRLTSRFTVAGPASVAFNPGSEEVYIVANDSLFTYSVPRNTVRSQAHLSGTLGLLPGNQSLYHPRTGRLYNLYVDQQLVSEYDFRTNRWSRNYEPGPITDYWQYNKVYVPFDSSLYIIGGYGHFRYKNKVQRYHLPSGKWSEVTVTGDRLTPRYLSALGMNAAGDTAWLLGGYGSASGEQIVNPRNLYDLVAFDIRRRTFKKMFELRPSKEGIAFGNSLVLDPLGRSFYALAYPNDKYSSQLQLIRGSLAQPGTEVLGKALPYSFHDIHSFADLYYGAASRRFVAVVLNRTETATSVSLYTLASPPVPAAPPVQDPASPDRTLFWTGALLLAAAAGFFGYRYYRRRKKTAAPFPAGTDASAAPRLQPVTVPEVLAESPPVQTVYLFGDLQLFDREGEEITRYLTPLLKELFLLILLHTLRKGTGITSEKLNEILWFEKDEKSARNNRSVNIAKLKNVLDRMGGLQIEKAAGYWRADIDSTQVEVDYLTYLQIVKNKAALSKEKISALARITRRGSFLANTEYAWLDAFKSDISNDIIDTYLRFAHGQPVSDDPEFQIHLANYIGYFDPVNEEAMRIKCRAYAYLGKHSLAKSTFENFTREYRAIYGEDFNRDLQEVLV
ncbi:MAG TPA: hypothetical protein VHK69_01890, partial [Chitinophagaceae bacterium]|nr:hypothetical protein [Chitinophagaceae bacterium]